MPPPLRKSFQRKGGDRNSATRGRAYALRLSGVTVAVLSLLLTAVVAWAFFMGFMVGRGQHPDRHMGEMTGILEKDTPPLVYGEPDTLGAEPSGAKPLPGSDVLDTGVPLGAETQPGLTPPPPVAEPPAMQAGPAPTQAPPAADALPFGRPSGESLAAWGIRPDSAPSAAASAPAEPVQGSPARVAPQPEARFDYVFQTAVFKKKDDADRLCARLEAAGMRSRITPDGKLYKVMVHLRGSQREAANLIEELQRMKLGKPLQRAKKAVPASGGRPSR